MITTEFGPKTMARYEALVALSDEQLAEKLASLDGEEVEIYYWAGPVAGGTELGDDAKAGWYAKDWCMDERIEGGSECKQESKRDAIIMAILLDEPIFD